MDRERKSHELAAVRVAYDHLASCGDAVLLQENNDVGEAVSNILSEVGFHGGDDHLVCFSQEGQGIRQGPTCFPAVLPGDKGSLAQKMLGIGRSDQYRPACAEHNARDINLPVDILPAIRCYDEIG